ncbi:MAG TPA: YceD family protein [Methylotenera sp.]|nr:YceD family protein [Methylotenera sp.]
MTAQLPRLAEMLVNVEKSQVEFQLSGTGKQFRQPSLHLNIKASLAVTCQRCLDEMVVDLNLNLDYLISNTEISEAEESDEIDWLEESHEMDVCELIEDELLLALPIAPTHAHDCSKLSTQSGDKPNPFAALKGLIK